MEINNVKIYGLNESIIASGYPMRVDLEKKLANEHDFDRAFKLSNSKIGSGHDNFLNGIIVQFDLKASLKFWPQMQRYHFVDFVSSQSLMHMADKFDFTEKNCFINNTNKTIIENLIDLQNDYKMRKEIYNKTKLKEDKEIMESSFNTLIYSIPLGFQYTARLTTNYRQLKTIYNQRKNHKLKEWQDYCKWIENLPISKLIL